MEEDAKPPISAFSTRDVVCQSCSESFSVIEWLAIDRLERADLVRRACQGEFFMYRCHRCEESSSRTQPLVLTRLADSLPFLALWPADETSSHQPGIEAFARLWDHLGYAPSVFHLPFAAASVLLSRDIDADVAERDSAIDSVRQSFGQDTANAYAGFLASAEAETETLELRRSLHLLDRATVSLEEFSSVIRRYPQLLTNAAQAELSEVAATSSTLREVTNRKSHALMLAAEQKIDEAFALYSEAQDNEAERINKSLDPLRQRIQDAIESGDWNDIVVAGREGTRNAPKFSYYYGEFALATANALAARPLQHPEDIEEALRLYRMALPLAGHADDRALVLANLGPTWGQRIRGDRIDNLDEAIRCLREAIEILKQGGDRDRWATVHTNLALALLHRSESALDPAAILREAREHCRQALTHRAPDRDVVDWAFTLVNLGAIDGRLAEVDEHSDPSAGADSYKEVIARLPADREPGLLARAYLNLGELMRRGAAAANSEHEKEVQLLEAVALLDTASDLAKDDPRDAGEVSRKLAAVYFDLRDRPAAIGALRVAVAHLQPEVAPRSCREAASDLGWVLSDEGRWDDSAQAYSQAWKAAHLCYVARLTSLGRQQEIQEARHLARWASYAIARSGDVVLAALTLEQGRAREFSYHVRQPQADLLRVREYAPNLYSAYESAAELVRSSAATADIVQDSFQQLHRAIEHIRELPGFEHFMGAASIDDIDGASEPGSPLVYINPTPYGTACLICWHSADRIDGRPSIELLLVNDLDSKSLIWQLISETDLPTGIQPAGYLPSASGMTDRFAEALDYILPLLGKRLVQPLTTHLRARGAHAICAVVSGPLGLVPLHAVTWNHEGEAIAAMGLIEFRYAPSALVHAECLRRANTLPTPTRFLGIGNPLPCDDPLPGAEAEVRQIATLFGSGESYAVREHATKKFVLDNATNATHIHFACHAQGDNQDFRQSAFLVGDDAITIEEILLTGRLVSRVAVASACQTGVFQMDYLSEEVFSLGAALLAAGSAASISALWLVDDYATALLITRFYEELLCNSIRPSAALRRAQLWLRRLGTDAEEQYLDGHPFLAAEFRRRDASGRRPGRRGVGTAVSGPYSHPEYWAGFVALGA